MAGLTKVARLYLIPGVDHCSGGAGTDTLNMLVELENRVEKCPPPGPIPATHSTDGKVDLSRLLCLFPQVAKHDGSGSVAEAG